MPKLLLLPPLELMRRMANFQLANPLTCLVT